jgi:monoterpene epsilon-lactone hydrolase
MSLRIKAAQRFLVAFTRSHRKKPYHLAADRRIGARALAMVRVARGVTEVREQVAGVPVHRYSSGSTRPGLILEFHGGAYVAGGPESARAYTRQIVAGGGPDLVAVDYRLAPEHPYPAGLDDAVAVYLALSPAPMVLMGDSAGGGLVLALTQRLRDEGLPLPAGVVAFFPWADLTQGSAGFSINAGRDTLHKADLDVRAREYAGELDVRTPGISPIFGSFAGFPPTLIPVGTLDSLIGDARTVYARPLEEGVDATLVEAPGAAHGFISLPVPEARRILAGVADFIRGILPA